MYYKILSARGESQEEAIRILERQVTSYIEEGWKPQGGVALLIRAFSYSKDTYYASQAMIKEDS